MTMLYVHRNEAGEIVYAGDFQEGYSEEALDDAAGELADWLGRVRNPVPGIVTAGSFIRAAHELDWLPAIDAAAQAAGQQNSLIPLLWNRASQFERHHPFVAMIGAAIGKTPEEVDDLFRLAGRYDQPIA